MQTGAGRVLGAAPAHPLCRQGCPRGLQTGQSLPEPDGREKKIIKKIPKARCVSLLSLWDRGLKGLRWMLCTSTVLKGNGVQHDGQPKRLESSWHSTGMSWGVGNTGMSISALINLNNLPSPHGTAMS